MGLVGDAMPKSILVPSCAAAVGGVSAPELMRHQECDMSVHWVLTDSEGGRNSLDAWKGRGDRGMPCGW